MVWATFRRGAGPLIQIPCGTLLSLRISCASCVRPCFSYTRAWWVAGLGGAYSASASAISAITSGAYPRPSISLAKRYVDGAL